MVLTRQGARKLLEAAGKQSQPPPPPSPTFQSFSCLAVEVRTIIWNAAEDLYAGHVIEVCNIPDHYDEAGAPISFEWKAIPCGCKKKCFDPALTKVNHEAREVALKRRSRCFGRWVDWDKDTIFIGDRVGHLHNTGFLNALEKENCREKIKHLAIDYECWSNSFGYPCPSRAKCNPAAMISRLPQLHQLLFTQNSGAWRDGNEIKPRLPNYAINQYRAADIDHPETFNHIFQLYREIFDKWVSRTEIDREKHASNHLPQHIDIWRCAEEDVEQVHTSMLGSYKPVQNFTDEREYGLDGSCGIALVRFDKIEGGYWWGPEDENELDFVKDFIQERFDRLKSVRRDTSTSDPDYTTWTPPQINYAIVRRTAPSCFTDDWDGLEREWMTYGEACWANDLTQSYEKRDKSRDYPAGQHYETYAKLYEASGLTPMCEL